MIKKLLLSFTIILLFPFFLIISLILEIWNKIIWIIKYIRKLWIN